MDNQKNLKDFLEEAELQQYYELFRDILKVTKLSQLKFVVTEDLAQIGLSKPEQRRYKKNYSKYFPNPYISKIKKFLTTNKHSDVCSPGHSSLPIEIPPFPENNVKVPTKHIIPVEDITINKELGMGQFGVVQQGTWTAGNQRLQVAIKCLGNERMTSNSTEFLKEAAAMHTIEHPNIVRLYGVVLHLDSLMLVTELAPLRSLLECLREVSLRMSFPVPNLCDFAEQICDGMTYLENKRLIHRDLAARNILVFTKDKVKISDFGLSRALGVGKDYYQTNYNVNLKLPVAWCAPECILYLRFTSASDVWAFAVCLWEMFTYGFQPWAAFSGQHILEAIDEPNFQRLERPECCPEAYYTTMLECWAHDPKNRPKFKDLRLKLREISPEQVQATVNYKKIDDRRRTNQLEYKSGQIITVLGKSDVTKSTLWYGVLPGGACGMFDPECTKPYVRPDPPRQVVTPYKPSEDLEQVPLINPNSPSHLSSASCTPYPLLTDNGPETVNCDEVDLSFADSRAKFTRSYKFASEPTTSKSILSKVKSATLGRSNKSEDYSSANTTKTDEIHEYHEISDTDTESIAAENAKAGQAKIAESLAIAKSSGEFSQSLLDEMETLFRKLDGSEPTDDNRVRLDIESALRSHTLNKSEKKKGFSTGTMKPMSAHDEKTLDTAVAMANEITTKSMNDLETTDSKVPHSLSEKKFHFKFPLVTLHHNTPNEPDKTPIGKQERRNFSEEAKSVRDIQSTFTKESKLAYTSLIEQPKISSVKKKIQKDSSSIKPATIPKPAPRVMDRVQFHSLNKQTQEKIRPPPPLEVKTIEVYKDVKNELPLPPRTNKPKLVDKPRHIRKYPLKMPEYEVKPLTKIVNRPIIYQNTCAIVGTVEKRKIQHTKSVSDCVYIDPNSLVTPGPSSENPISSVDQVDGAECEALLVKDCTDHVSVEDLLEFADNKPCGRQRGVESDEVRIMSKVLKQVTPEECLEALELSEWNVHLAIKIVRVKIAAACQVNLLQCHDALKNAKGDILKASAVLVLCEKNNKD